MDILLFRVLLNDFDQINEQFLFYFIYFTSVIVTMIKSVNITVAIWYGYM